MRSARRPAMTWLPASLVYGALVVVLSAVAPAAAPAEQWQVATDVSDPLTKSAFDGLGGPSVAVAPDGTTYIVYQQTNASVDTVWAAVRRPGDAFAKAVRISATGEDAYAPTVAVDRQGTATVVFGAGGFVKARTGHGDGWGAETQVSADAQATVPALAVGDGGAAVVAYYDHGTGKLTAALRGSGQEGFGPPAQVSGALTNVDIAAPPQVAMDAAGDAVVAWDLYTGTHAIQASAAPAGHGFTAPKGLSTAAPVTGQFAVAMTPGGRAAVAWDQVSGGGSAVRIADATITPSFTAAGWSASSMVSSGLEYSVAPFLAYDAAGVLIATWSAGAVSPADHVAGAVRLPGGTFPAPQTISTSAVRDDIEPLAGGGPVGTRAPVVTTPGGDAAVVWVAASAGGQGVFAARRAAGQVQFADVTTAAAGAGTVLPSLPAVGIDGDTDVFTSWLRTDGAQQRVQATALDTAAPAIGAVTVPATAIAGQSVEMGASAADAVSGTSVRWDFGDTQVADGTTTVHAYGAAGTFTVTVTATDGAGNSSATTRQIAVSAPSGGGPVDRPPGGKVAPLPKLSATAALRWHRLRDGRTQLVKLTIAKAGIGTTVRLSCTGKGCRRSMKRTVKTTSKTKLTLSLTKYVKGVRLKPRAQLRVELTHAGVVGRVYTYTMVKRRDPKRSVRCLDPGAKWARAC